MGYSKLWSGVIAVGLVLGSPVVFGQGGLEEIPDDPYLPPSPGKPVTTAAAFVVQGSFLSVQVNVDADGNNIVGDAANEPSIAVDRGNPMRIAIGWRQFDTIASNFRQAGWGYTQDGGSNWTFPGVIEPGVFRSDPVLESDANGTFYYYSLTNVGGFSCQLFRSFDGGITWDGGVDGYGGDKQWMAIDRSGGVGQGNVYGSWTPSFGCCGDDRFTRSTDDGDSFEPPVPIPEVPIWGVLTVDPEGSVYSVGRRQSNSSEFIVSRSLTAQDPAEPIMFESAEVDLGGNIVFGDGPNPGGLLGQVWIAVDPTDGPTQGYIYVLCSVNPPGSDPVDVHFIRSVDGGFTWSLPMRINDDPIDGDTWQWFGTMSVAPNGRIDVIWNDTRNDPGGFDSQMYYSFSTDGGETWSPNEDLTPAWDPHIGWPDQEKIGDYYDMVSDDVGAHVAFSATFNGEQDVYYLRIGDFDCNVNGVPDSEDIASGTSEDSNGNGIPDECENTFVRGDSNGDGAVGIADPIYELDYLFTNGPSLCLDAQDVNDDGILDISDPTFSLGFQFANGPAPPAPFPPPACGVDTTSDGLNCLDSPSCP